jgi:hypothetical protein
LAAQRLGAFTAMSKYSLSDEGRSYLDINLTSFGKHHYCLLGLNVLTYFNFRFDYRKWKFHIKPIATPKKLFPMLPNQSICEVEEN